MSTDEFIKIVDKCIEEGITQFHLVPTIGDPFLDRGIFDKLDYLDSISSVDSYLVTTNFIAITTSKIDTLLQYNKLNLDISVYGYNKQTYIDNTGIDSFNKFHNNLKALYECIQRHNRNNYDIDLTIRCGIPYGIHFPKTPMLFTISKLLLLDNISVDNDNTLNFNRGGNIPTGSLSNEPISKIRRGVCPALKDLAGGILPGGDVLFCPCHDMYRTGVVGNLYKNTLKEIRGEGKFQKIRKEHSNSIYTGICKDCNDYN